MAQDVELSIWEHLAELRGRLAKALIALMTGFAISLAFTERVLKILEAPLGESIPQTLYPTETFVVFFRIAMILGLVLAMPVIVYQLVRYALPGLEPQEKRYLYFLIPGVGICFATGVGFAMFLMLPAAITFLQGFLTSIIENHWTLDNYIGFVTNVMFWMGIVFEMPLIMFFLAKLGLITPKKLSGFRRYAIVLNAVIAAAVTPTPDPVNMAIVMIPLVLLYEVGVILARIAVRGRKPDDVVAAT